MQMSILRRGPTVYIPDSKKLLTRCFRTIIKHRSTYSLQAFVVGHMPNRCRVWLSYDWSNYRAVSEAPKRFLFARRPQPITKAGSRFLSPKAIPLCFFHDLAEDVDMSVTDLPCADRPSLDNVRVLEAVQFR